jgi:hypothetical protein
MAAIADATGIRHQGSGLDEGGGGVAGADQRVFDCALASNLLWPAVWLSQSIQKVLVCGSERRNRLRKVSQPFT